MLTEDGYIITNNHVVEGGSAYEVMVAGETYEPISWAPIPPPMWPC